MLDFGFYNMDCAEGMKEFPDGFFDLAVVDPPYGIKVFAKDNASRSKLATSKSYKEYAGGDTAAPDDGQPPRKSCPQGVQKCTAAAPHML